MRESQGNRTISETAGLPFPPGSWSQKAEDSGYNAITPGNLFGVF